jgi:hypothetical protein
MKSYKNIPHINYIIWISLSIIIFSSISFSQKLRLVDRNKGNHNNNKMGFMDGNLVGTVYYNMGEIADWKYEPDISGVWPKGTNHTYVDGVAVIVQAEAKAPGGQLIHPLETNYYEYTRINSQGTTYGWWSLPGYASPYQSGVARSDDQNTWPASWPDQTSDWNGQWDGFFGKNIKNADLETFFVFDDNEDRQYIDQYNFRPDAGDSTRGGLGMQVRARGFQWSQVLAEDVIFWYYEITNMSTTDYSKTLFAQYVDWGIGGHANSSNNAGAYNKVLNISYAWSTVLFGNPGNWSPVGYAGYAFLESPGISDDNIDNDLDGLTDERRDNDARVFITRPEDDPFMRNLAIDTVNFKNFYGHSWRQHWDADENENWRTFEDLNHNGKWDPGEPLNDDVGTDGLGPYDPGYPGPDPDGTEGDGKPEQGEPNFGIFDKDESDQLGLTGFAIFAAHTYDLNNDENNWSLLSPPSLHGQTLLGVNLTNFFSSSLFPMMGRNTYIAPPGEIQGTGETQRFSMALIFGLNTDDLFRRKNTVQSIYNANYHFAQPPAKPIVKAIAGDHKVTLYWDNLAETTFDPFYQKVNFEGYRIYRSTEPNFIEDKTITDAYGVPVYRLPLAIFDLVDGVKGLHPIDIQGAKFNLGDDSGLQHSYVDSTVTNGQVYYYAVCSYDQGFVQTNIQGLTEGIPPSETTSIIKVDINGNYKTDINTAVVIPHVAGAGYIDPKISNFSKIGPATGTAGVTIIDPDSMKAFNTYRVEFLNNFRFSNNPNPSYRIVNYSTNDTLLKFTPFSGSKVQTLVLQGFSVSLTNDSVVGINYSKTGWEPGSNSTYLAQAGFETRGVKAFGSTKVNYPADFEIRFVDPGKGDTSFSYSGDIGIPSNIIIKDLTDNIDHFQFAFFDDNNNNLFDAGDAVFLAFGDSTGKKAIDYTNQHFSWSVSLIKDTSIIDSKQILPKPGDVIKITTTKPFRTGDYIEFTTQKADFNRSKALGDMDKIAVVPNPYVGAASWEPATATIGRGERLVYFIHLPNKCTIRIYTISGNLVKTLYRDAPLTDGQEQWDLTTKDGMSVAFGVYIFHVDAPGIGTKIGKFAIIK